jgi:LacI family transcriptional regulator
MPQLAADLPSSSDSTEDVEELLAHVLSVGVPDAIVTYNDMYAFSLMGALRNVGIEPGRDVAVVSFDDVPDAARSYPSLTSASGFPEIVGSRATDLVVEAVRAGGLPPARRLLVRPELSARRSTLAWGEARAAKASTTRTEDNLLPRRA